MILGIDEAGRGPWAGPLVVGAVVLGYEIDGLDDSKKLTKKRREQLEVEILSKSQAAATGWVSSAELDEQGMSEALRLATRRAVEQIRVPYHEIIIDGTVNSLAGTSKGDYVKTLAKADSLIPSVSAASIVAKVARDRYMAALDDKYPGYNFASHAGYGVAKHRQAIDELGVTPEHRLSFAPLQKYREVTSTTISDERSARDDKISGDFQQSAELPAQERVKQSSTGLKSPKILSRLHHNRSNTAVDVPTTRSIGDISEAVAANELVRRGHTILERNWKTKYCEIDIISQKDDVLYFTEVKHRKNDKAGGGLAAITPKKLNQMKFAAKLYVHSQKMLDIDMRLVAVSTVGNECKLQNVVFVD